MLKKIVSVIVPITVLGVAIVPAMAGEIKSYTWPCEFKPLVLCDDIPVYLDVGLYVEILDQHSLKIKLEQEDFDTYSGSCTIQVKSNFNIILGCHVVGNENADLMHGYFRCYIQPDEFVGATMCETVEERTVEVVYDNVDIVHHQFGKNIQVGTAIITVKPGFGCTWEDP
jgi:hypothetical protein